MAAPVRKAFQHNGQTVFEWEQTLEEVLIYIRPPQGVRGKDLDIHIQPNHLTVGLQGADRAFLDEDLYATVDTDASLWTLDDGELVVSLQKMRTAETWASVLKGKGTLKTDEAARTREQILLERFQREHPGFDFSGASFSGNAPDARSFMGGMHQQ